MALVPSPTDYTNRDYTSLLASLLDLAAIKLPEWTDRSENDIGRMIMELFAYVGDVQLYYIDRAANEGFLATAIERRSVIDLLGLIGYTLSTPSPASALLTITVANDVATPVVVDVGAVFATQALPGKPAVAFVYLPPNGQPLSVPRTGTGRTQVFELPTINATRVGPELLGLSTGEANQPFTLAQEPVILARDPTSDGYFRVEVDIGVGFVLWTRRATFLNSLGNDTDYIVLVDDQETASVVFGDNTYGMIPPAGASIRVTYLIGGGAQGNVGPNTITVIKQGVSVSATATNALAASGGADSESIDHARQLAPMVYRSLDRAVTATDYAALAEGIPGVAKAVAVGPSSNYVDIYVVAAGGLPPSELLQTQILAFFETRRLVTTIVSVRSPIFVVIDMSITIGVHPSSYNSDVQQRVSEALSALFEITLLDFGQPFYLSQVYETAGAVVGVKFVKSVDTFAGTRTDSQNNPMGSADTVPPNLASGTFPSVIELRNREFPKLGMITVNASGGIA